MMYREFTARLLRFASLALAMLLSSIIPAYASETLIPTTSTWKYLDSGVDQGTDWQLNAFDDSSWSSGAAELGYGDGDETTVVNGGPVDDRYPTTYFRHSFFVSNPATYTALTLKVRRDDGVAVYLNGIEVMRKNIVPGANYWSNAITAISGVDESTFITTSIPASALLTGTNVIAAEIHQSSATSSDISFALELLGNTLTDTPEVIRGPYLQQVSATSAIIRWRTNVATDTRVNYGTSFTNRNGLAQNSALTTEHEITVTGLSPSTQYFYSIGSIAQELVIDASQFFKTAPVIGTRTPTRIWVIGDAGWGTVYQDVVYQAYRNFTGSQYTDLWMMLGDNAYAVGSDQEYQTGMFDMYPELLRQTGVWSTLGNHDSYSFDSNTQQHPYYDIFTLPAAAQVGGIASGTEAYYSFNQANIHFIVLDSQESNHALGSPMLNWLVSDLQANSADWTIAVWHHPPYSKGSHDSDYEARMVEMRTNVIPILDTYGVDLVLSGHSHSYERSKFVDGHYGLSTTYKAALPANGGHTLNAGSGDPDRGATPYSKTFPTVAHSGAVYAVVGSSGTIGGGQLNHPVMYSSLNELGSMVIDVNNITLSAKFVNNNGTTRDAFTLQKLASGSDADLDGFMNVIDNCQNIANSNQSDFDLDLQGDACDNDDDNDGTLDAVDAFPRNASESKDNDQDGIGNNTDNCTTLANPSQEDTNTNGVGDVCETGTHPLDSEYHGSHVLDKNTTP